MLLESSEGARRCPRGRGAGDVFFVFFTLVKGPRRSLSLQLSDARVYEPQIRACPLPTGLPLPQCPFLCRTVRRMVEHRFQKGTTKSKSIIKETHFLMISEMCDPFERIGDPFDPFERVEQHLHAVVDFLSPLPRS